MEAIDALQKRFDLKFGAAVNRYGSMATCGKGCAACCYEPTYVDHKEVRHMLEALDATQLDAIKERTRAWLDKAKKSGMFEFEQPPVVAYRQIKLACPFLVDNQCSVYEKRPIACRSHTAIGPRQFCDNDAERLDQRYVYCPELTQGATMEMFNLSNEMEMDNIGVILARLLLGVDVKTKAYQKVTLKQ